MLLKVLGSSSKGNCFILENEEESLIIECGIPFLEIKKGLNFNLKKVVGCLCSHEHKDHSKSIKDVIKAGIPVYSSWGTLDAVGVKVNAMKHGKLYHVGGFKVIPFDTMHDCAEPFGFFINHPETGNFIFATDTYYLPNRFENLSNIIIECNYRLDLLEDNIDKGKVSFALRNRTIQSHMSFDTCKEALVANDLSKVNNIVLIHLSDSNSNAKEFKDGIYRATGKTVHIAEKGLCINFNKTPI